MKFTNSIFLAAATAATVSAQSWSSDSVVDDAAVGTDAWPHWIQNIQVSRTGGGIASDDIATAADTPLRVQKGVQYSFTIEASDDQSTADKAGFVLLSDGNCDNVSNAVSPSSAGKVSWTFSKAGTYALCYQWNTDKYGPKPFQFYSDLFHLDVVGISAVTDQANAALSYRPLLGVSNPLTLTGVNVVDGDKIYLIGEDNDSDPENDPTCDDFATGDILTDGPLVIANNVIDTYFDTDGASFNKFTNAKVCFELKGDDYVTEAPFELEFQEWQVGEHWDFIPKRFIVCNDDQVDDVGGEFDELRECTATFTVYGDQLRTGDVVAVSLDSGTADSAAFSDLSAGTEVASEGLGLWMGTLTVNADGESGTFSFTTYANMDASVLPSAADALVPAVVGIYTRPVGLTHAVLDAGLDYNDNTVAYTDLEQTGDFASSNSVLELITVVDEAACTTSQTGGIINYQTVLAEDSSSGAPSFSLNLDLAGTPPVAQPTDYVYLGCIADTDAVVPSVSLDAADDCTDADLLYSFGEIDPSNPIFTFAPDFDISFSNLAGGVLTLAADDANAITDPSIVPAGADLCYTDAADAIAVGTDGIQVIYNGFVSVPTVVAPKTMLIDSNDVELSLYYTDPSQQNELVEIPALDVMFIESKYVETMDDNECVLGDRLSHESPNYTTDNTMSTGDSFSLDNTGAYNMCYLPEQSTLAIAADTDFAVSRMSSVTVTAYDYVLFPTQIWVGNAGEGETIGSLWATATFNAADKYFYAADCSTVAEADVEGLAINFSTTYNIIDSEYITDGTVANDADFELCYFSTSTNADAEQSYIENMDTDFEITTLEDPVLIEANAGDNPLFAAFYAGQDVTFDLVGSYATVDRLTTLSLNLVDCDGVEVASGVSTSVTSNDDDEFSMTLSATMAVTPGEDAAVWCFTQHADNVQEAAGSAMPIYTYEATAITGTTQANFAIAGIEDTYKISSGTGSVHVANIAPQYKVVLVTTTSDCDDAGDVYTFDTVNGDVDTDLQTATAETLFAVGGDYHLCFVTDVQGDTVNVDTGLTFSAIEVTDVWPTVVTETFATDVWITGVNLNAADILCVNSGTDCGDCSNDNDDALLVPGVVDGDALRFEIPSSIEDEVNLCLVPFLLADKTDTDNMYDTGLTIEAVNDLEYVDDLETNYQVYADQTNTYQLEVETTADKPHSLGESIAIVNGAVCDEDAIAAAVVATETGVIAYKEHSFEATLAASNTKYSVCLQDDNTSDEAYNNIGTIGVSAAVSIEPSYLIKSDIEMADFTVTGLGLFTGDKIGLSASSNTGHWSITNAGLSADDETMATATFSVDNADNLGLEGLTSLWYFPTSHNSNTYPVSAATDIEFTVVVVETCDLANVILSDSATDVRSIGISGAGLHADDSIFFSTQTCAAASGDNASNPSEGRHTQAFESLDTYRLCFRSGLGGETSDYVQVNENAVDVVARAAATFSHQPHKVVAGVDTTITLTGSVQSGDKVKLVANDADCAGTGADEPMAVGTIVTIADECAATGTINVPETADALNVCYNILTPADEDLTSTGFASINTDASMLRDLLVQNGIVVSLLKSFAPSTISADVREEIAFEGTNVESGDFVSFVSDMYTTCEKSWMYEQGLSQDLTATFILPAGSYKTCAWARETTTGYYMIGQSLDVKSITAISPTFTSLGLSTDFEIISGTDNVNALPSAKDRVSFILDSQSCAADAGAEETTRNVTVSEDGRWWLVDVTLSVEGTYGICTDYELSENYNVPSGSNINSFSNAHLVADITVEVAAAPFVGEVFPTHIVAGVASELVFNGAFLGNDELTLNATCTNATIDANLMTATAGEEDSLHESSIVVTIEETGVKNICYRTVATEPTFATVNPTGDLMFYVVDVATIAPTSVQPQAEGDAVELTFTGYFGATDASVALIDAEGDCETDAMSAELFSTLTIAADVMSATASFNFTAGAEYKTCVWFDAIDSWTSYDELEFSVRQIAAISPVSIIDNTDATLQLTGTGIRAGDMISFLNVSDSTLTCATDFTANAVDVAADGSVELVGPTEQLPEGEYRLCFKFGVLDWEAVDMLTLVAEPAIIKTITTPAEVIASEGSTYTVTGTGIQVGDQVKFSRNATSNADCNDPTKTTSVVVVSQVNGEYTFTIGADEFEVSTGTSYSLCFNFGATTDDFVLFPSLTVTPKAVIVIEGNAPRKLIGDQAAVTVSVFGTQMSANDKVAFTSTGSCTGIVGLPVVLASSTQITVVSAFTGLTSTVGSKSYKVCYQSFAAGDTSLKIQPATSILLTSGQAKDCGAGKFSCESGCQSTPCTVTANCADPAKFFCAASGVCRRTPFECPSVNAACANVACPDGTCAATAAQCPVIDACPSTHIRCIDGSCSNNGCFFRGVAITAPSCGTSTANFGSCGLTAAQASSLRVNGCGIGQGRCADCTCSTQCKDNAGADSCAFTSKVATGAFVLAEASSRRFAVKANAAIEVTLNGKNGAVATVAIPAGATDASGCVLDYGSVSDSEILATYGKDVISSVVTLSLESDAGVCALVDGAAVDVTFATVLSGEVEQPAAEEEEVEEETGSGSATNSTGSGSGSSGSGSGSSGSGSGSSGSGSTPPPAESEINCQTIGASAGATVEANIAAKTCSISGRVTGVAFIKGQATPVDAEEEGSTEEEEEEGSTPTEEEEGSAPTEEEGTTPDEEEEGDDKVDSASALAGSFAVAVVFVSALLL